MNTVQRPQSESDHRRSAGKPADFAPEALRPEEVDRPPTSSCCDRRACARCLLGRHGRSCRSEHTPLRHKEAHRPVHAASRWGCACRRSGRAVQGATSYYAELQRDYGSKAVHRLIHDLDETYQGVKRQRRELRLVPDDTCPRSIYEEVTRNISELQLDAELLKREARSLESALPALVPLGDSFETLDSYLSKLWSEAGKGPQRDRAWRHR